MAAPFLSTPNLLVPTAIGLGLSGFYSGASLTLTYINVPALLLAGASSQSQAKVPQQPTATSRPAASASQLARQWRFCYITGKATLLPLSLVASTFFAYVAWSISTISPANVAAERSLNGLKWIFAVAASFAFSSVPWTLATMMRTNNIMFARADQADAVAESGKADASEEGMKGNDERGLEGMTTEELMHRWGFLNMIRSGLMFSAVITVAGGLYLYA